MEETVRILPNRGSDALQTVCYRILHEEVEGLVREINERHGGEVIVPIDLEMRHRDPGRVFELFRAADLCIVSSLHDGMNLLPRNLSPRGMTSRACLYCPVLQEHHANCPKL